MEKLSVEDLKRKKIIDDYIEDRTSDENIKNSKKELREVSTIIKQLNDFIDGSLELNAIGIEIRIKRLISHFTINLIYELDSNIAFRRARKFEEKTSKVDYFFDEVQDMSYIPDDKKSRNRLGRFNQKAESIYYASIHYEDDELKHFSTALSEINTNKLDYINVLDSVPKKRLNVVYLGVFDYFIRNKETPKWIDSTYRTVFEAFKSKCIEIDSLDIFEQYILSNAFLADITQREGSDRLYEVTSTLSSCLLKPNEVEAIVYESVKVRNEPNIAIKPIIVDKYIVHRDAYSFKINEDLGYGMYDTDLIN